MKKFLIVITLSSFLLVSCGSSSDEAKKEENKKPAPAAVKKNAEKPAAKFVKPEKFPQKTVDSFSDSFTEGAHLSPEIIMNVGLAYTEYIRDDTEKSEKRFNDVAAQYGFASAEDLQQATGKIFAGMTILKLMNNQEKTENPGDLAVDMTKSILGQAQISKQDLKMLYDNWDDAVATVTVLEKLKK